MRTRDFYFPHVNCDADLLYPDLILAALKIPQSRIFAILHVVKSKVTIMFLLHFWIVIYIKRERND